NTGGGPFTITVQQAGAVLTVNAGNIASGGGAINLTADDMTLTGTVSAGAGIVTLQPTTLSRPIDLGTNSAGATLGLTDAELDRVTTTTALRVGSLADTGAITISQAISQAGSGYTTLSLRTTGAITQAPGAPGTVTNPALQGGAGVSLGATTTKDVAIVAGAAPASGAAFTYFDANGLTIGAVDGVSGVVANAAAIDVETFGGTLTVANTPAANDVDTTGGNLTLIAR